MPGLDGAHSPRLRGPMPSPQNGSELECLTGAASLVLGEDHPLVYSLARALTTRDDRDAARAVADFEALRPAVQIAIVGLAERVAE